MGRNYITTTGMEFFDDENDENEGPNPDWGMSLCFSSPPPFLFGCESRRFLLRWTLARRASVIILSFLFNLLTGVTRTSITDIHVACIWMCMICGEGERKKGRKKKKQCASLRFYFILFART